jgi:hypothetical protein
MSSDTIAGMIVMAVFIAWCLYMAGWILYMNWPRHRKYKSELRNADLPEPEPPDEFDIEQML